MAVDGWAEPATFPSFIVGYKFSISLPCFLPCLCFPVVSRSSGSIEQTSSKPSYFTRFAFHYLLPNQNVT
jgi:hypothetical protein